jgi:transposase-like protein
MERVPKAVYTKEFKEEAVKLVTEAGLSIPEVGRGLSLSKSTMECWIRQTRKGTLSDNSRKKAVSPEEMEVARLRKENAALTMEREI